MSLITLIEGGIGLIAAGSTVLYSPILNKATERIFNSEPWNFKRQKKSEQRAIKWILIGCFLVIEALIISAI